MAERSATPAAAQQSQLSQNQYLLLFSGEAHNVEVGIHQRAIPDRAGGASTSRSASAA
jgi:hypothetical protein